MGPDSCLSTVTISKWLEAGHRRSRCDRHSLLSVSFAAVLYLASQGSAAQHTNKVSAAQAQNTQAEKSLSAYEGQKVSSIALAGRPDFDTSRCPQCFVQAAGQPFSLEKVEQTADALKNAGHFSHVDIQAEPDAIGVHIVFVLEPAVYFGIFTFPGAKHFPYSQLIQASNYPIQEAFNPSEIESDRQSLLTFYRQEGFFQAKVDLKTAIDSANAIANVEFDSPLGKRAKFGATEITNAPDSETPALERRLTTWQARFRGAGIRADKSYHHSTVNKASQYLQKSLEKEGYLGAQVKLSGAEYHAATNRADIHFDISSGPVTRVQIEGAHLWPWTRKSLLPIYQGVGVDDETVTEGRQALISYFQAKGFFDVTVESQLNKGTNSDTVIYKITRDKKHKVSAVHLTGNTSLPSSQLTPQISVEKKHLFSPGKFSDQLVETSIKNLKAVYQSEGFSDAQVTSAMEREGGNVDISFRVREGPRDVVNSLTIEGADTFPQTQFAPHGLKLAAGQPYSQAHVQADRAEIISNYLKAGYLIASFRETASKESKSETHRINVVYHIHEGPRVTTGDVLTLGRDRTRQRLIDKDVSIIRPEKPLTESGLLAARQQSLQPYRCLRLGGGRSQGAGHHADQGRCAG